MGNRLFFVLLAAGLPLSIAGSLLHWEPTMLFVIYCVTILRSSTR
ncbi:hypothetical protein [Paenibacillus sp.]|nr:hypothetical protein [Paenibacillus sp.]